MEDSDIKLMKEEQLEKNNEEEENFVKLFHQVLTDNRGQLSDEDIARGVKKAIQYFTEGISGACDRGKYEKADTVCGVFHRFSSLFAGITRNRILIALSGCEELRLCFHRSSLKLVDVGSGSGSDLVGLFSALYEKKFPFQSLEVTAMDYNKKWEKFFTAIKDNLSRGNFGNASCFLKEKEIRYSYVCADMLCLIPENKEKLNAADIILMKGVLSILKYKDERSTLIENLVQEMKKGALLVVLESPTYEEYFQKDNLHLVFTTRKFLPSTSKYQNSQVPSVDNLEHSTPKNIPSTSESVINKSGIEDVAVPISNSKSHVTWENFDSHKMPDTDDYYRLSCLPFLPSEVKIYGRGLATKSNQQIFVLIKQ